MSYKSCRKALLLSLAICLIGPATLSPVWAADEEAKNAKIAAESTSQADDTAKGEKSSKSDKDKHHKKDEMSDYQRRHEAEGYYGSMSDKKQSYSDNQRRHEDEGYYSEVKPYVAPPPEKKVEAAPPPPPDQTMPPPLIVPAVGHGGGGDRKFDDDPGATGSVTATRHAKQAREMLSSGQYEFAKRHFRESLELVPDQKDLYPGYWESCVKTNDWSQAQHALEKMFELEPNKKPEFSWAYGQALYKLHKYDRAAQVLRESLKYGKNSEDIHRDLLGIAQQQHDNAAVAAEYNALLKIRPMDYDMQLEFGKLLETQGKNADAIAHYKSACSLKPTDGALAARVAYMLMYYNKDFKNAIAWYNKAAAADPTHQAQYEQNIKYCEYQIKGPDKAKVQQ